jgi:large subunit ribosomal protein L24
MAAPLSKELAAQKGVKTLPVRKGDTVKIQRGDHKGFEGKISRIDLKHFRIYMEGLTREKTDGTNIFLAVHPSKVMIRNLNLDDKWRKNIISRKEAPESKKEKEEKVKATPPVKKTKVEEEKPMAAAEEQPTEPEVEAPVAKKAPAKKTAAKAPAKKEAKPKVAKKAPAKEKAEEEPKKAAKSRAKPKTSKKVEGGQ